MSQTATDEDRAATPSALQRLTEDDASRRRFLKIVGAGGAGAFSVLLAACGSSSSSSSSSSSAPTATTSSSGGDVGIVNYALTLEYLETAFYGDVINSGLFSGSNLSLLKRIHNTEQQHVAALTATVKQLGGTPAAVPKTKFPLKSAGEVVQLAATVENLGAAAYLGQVGNIQSKEVLAAALSIHSVEGRHAAALNTLAGKSITPEGAFAKGADMNTVLAAVKPFIVS